MSNLTTLLRKAGIPVRPISKAEEMRLRLLYPTKRAITVRIPARHKHLRDRVVPVSAVYGMNRVRDKNGEPWTVVPDDTGLATYLATAQ